METILFSILVVLVILLVFFVSKNSYNNKKNNFEIETKNTKEQCEQRILEIKKTTQAEIENIKDEYEQKTADTSKLLQYEYERYKNDVDEKAERKIAIIKNDYDKVNSCLKNLESNLTAIPYMSGIIADIETYGLENLALGLSWGHSQTRLNKVKSIREIRKDAQAMVEKNKAAQYQLAYLLELFPALSDVIEADFENLPAIQVNELSDYDHARNFLSQEEYSSLSVIERNQLALDRYKSSHNKTKWQIGRDYEQYVCYKYRQKGYDVDDFGSYMGLEDLGRDIIAKKDDNILIIQCKYWSSIKQIHEKHITQLYGTTISYCIENNISTEKVKGVLITNIRLSEMAKKMANHLGVIFVENYELQEYPCIKCNIGHDEYGQAKIYHLPFDQQYDSTKINKNGEFYAMTVMEAENAGFRRAFKWFGNK